jgi:hypothetical protein
MKRFSGLLFVWVMVLAIGLGGVQAQDDPLLIVMDGALYQWSSGSQVVTLYTNCTPSERIVSDIALSNDGRIAFMTEPQVVTDIVMQFGGSGGPLPTNIWVCDGTSLTTLATQPDNFSYFDADVPDVAIARSTPTWSLDGTALAWTAFDFVTGALTLDVYNATGDGDTISTPLELPDFVGEIAPPFITWNNNGIYLFHATLDPETFAYVDFVFLYDGLGNLMFETQMPPTDEMRFVYDKFIIEDRGQEWIGLLYSDNVWELVNPASGEVQVSDGVGELYSASGNSDISLLLTLDDTQQYVWTAKNDAGIIIDVNGDNVAVPGVFPTSTELSSNGVWVFQLFDGLYYWSMSASGYIDGTEPVTTGFSALAWSNAQWRIYRDS